MNRPAVVLRALIGLGLVLSSLAASAQDRLLEIEQSTIQPAIQMGRPIPTWWDVTVHGNSLVEGRFEFQMLSDGQLLETVTTEDLAIAAPQQRIRVLLPPINGDHLVEQLELKITFHGKRVRQDLGSHLLRVALPSLRTFMVLTAATRLAPRRSKVRDQILERLQVESLAADLGDMAKCVRTALEPADLPQEPLAYCAYELVILFGEEFRLLKKPQLDALSAWVRAGGSLYLEPTGVLEPYHVDFLRGLTASGPGGMVFQPDSNGRLIPGTIWNDERLFKLKNSLGRIVLRVDGEQPEFSVDTPPWREASAFLWRLYSDQVRPVAREPAANVGPFLKRLPGPNLGVRQRQPVQFGGDRLSENLPTATEELVNWLMPDGVRMVPLWVLGLILSVFVAWIGPVDYFGLGWLKARKYTWLTFPLATALITGLTVWITNAYMSTAETRRGLVIRDVGDDGSIVRTNRFELVFIASTRPVTTDVRKGLFVPMATGHVPFANDPYQQRYRAAQYARRFDDGRETRTPARSQGRIPTEFTVTQEIAKWTPQLNRMFWIPGIPDDAPVDWQRLTEVLPTDENFNLHLIPDDLRSRVRQTFGSKALVALVGSQGRWAFDRQSAWSGRIGNSSAVDTSFAESAVPILSPDVQGQPELFRWLYSYSVAAPYGLFGLTSQVGPAGGADLNDLPILDSSDPDRALLIVVVPRGDDFVVYRRLLRMRK